MNTTHSKIASQDQSLLHIGRIPHDWTNADAADVHLPDGHRDAVRVRLDHAGAVIECNGRIGICAPWALQWSGAADPKV